MTHQELFAQANRALHNGAHQEAIDALELLSDRDPDPANYDVRVESADLQALLTATDIGRAHFIGTSRGGIHIMALAAMRPAAIATAVLNDIGPVIALPGLMRIKDYVGRLAVAFRVEAMLLSTMVTISPRSRWMAPPAAGS